MATHEEHLRDVIAAYADAWSSQDVEGVLSLCAQDLHFEDIPFGLVTDSIDEMREMLASIFENIPDFEMALERVIVQGNFATTLWTQSGTLSLEWEDMNVNNHDYSVKTTTIFEFNDDGKIALLIDNWDISCFYRQQT